MSNGSVQVTFPSKMEVYAPGLQGRLDELLKEAKALSWMVEAGFKDTSESLRVLRQLPVLVEAFQKEMAAQFANIAEQEMETRIVVRSANILAAQQKIETTREYQAQLASKLGEDVKELSERYMKLLVQVKTECEEYVRGLDSHVFDVVDRIFPEFEEQLRSVYGRAGEKIRRHLVTTADARQVGLDEGLASLEGPLNRFLEQRRAFRALDYIGGNTVTEGWYELPLVVIEIEDIDTGATTLQVLLHPSQRSEGAMSETLGTAIRGAVSRGVARAERDRLAPEDVAMVVRALVEARVPESGARRLEEEQVGWIRGEEVRP